MLSDAQKRMLTCGCTGAHRPSLHVDKTFQRMRVCHEHAHASACVRTGAYMPSLRTGKSPPLAVPTSLITGPPTPHPYVHTHKACAQAHAHVYVRVYTRAHARTQAPTSKATTSASSPPWSVPASSNTVVSRCALECMSALDGPADSTSLEAAHRESTHPSAHTARAVRTSPGAQARLRTQ